MTIFRNFSVSLIAVVSILFIIPGNISSQNLNEITVSSSREGRVEYAGFTLRDDAEISISGYGGIFDYYDSDNMAFYGWILDSRTREVVWDMYDEYDLDREYDIVSVDETLSLPKGDYEVYYASVDDDGVDIRNFGDLLDLIFDGDRRNFKRKYKDKLLLNIAGPEGIFIPNNGDEIVNQMSDDAIVSFIRVMDDEYIKKGFRLSAETKIQIYGLGEGRRDDTYDYGWIYDVGRSEKVWSMKARYAEDAGGGSKNYLVDEELVLPEGNYMVYYASDGSHSFEEWNVLPPFDPQFWGLSIWVADDSDISNVEKFVDVKEREPVVKINRVRDDEYIGQGIKLTKDLKLRVLGLGEGSGRREMADYGWIMKADSREIVWEMNIRDSEHASGGSKNRLVDDTINLEKGEYIICYISDGSHSYGDWNTTPPFNRERWGITIWTQNEEDRSFITKFDPSDFTPQNVIVQIIRVRDDAYISKSFSLDKDTKIKIYAIGEGTRGGMDDYGWIKNSDTGKIVWEMSYRNTERAGGARKNRLFNDSILLEKGKYKVYYESDGSHSYRDWNDDPPREQERYGITIMK